MLNFVYRVWSEWDIGERDVVFASRQAAINWINNNRTLIEACRSEGAEFDTVWNVLGDCGEALVGVRCVKVLENG